MFCTKCGKPIPQGAQFCPHCGAAQTTTTGAAQPVSNPVPQSSTYTPIPTALPEKPKVRPWIRFWARWIDINLISFLGAFALAFYYPELASVPSKDLILAVVVLFLWVFIESFLLSTAGTTPGKWLLNIHLTPPLGNKPDFSTAFSRSFDVWWRGLGLGLPFVTLFTNAAAYTNLKKNGITTWDRNGGFTVVHERVGLLKGGLAILFISGTLILFVLFSTNKSALIGSTSLTPSPTEENRRSFSIEEAYSTSLTPSPTEENTRPSQSEGFEAEYKAWQEKQLRKEIDAPVKSEQKPWERVYQAQGDNSNARRDAWVKEQMKDTEQEDARKKAWVNEQLNSSLIAGRYLDNNDGTVTDTQTGLQWKRCYEGQHFVSGACIGKADEYSWNNAKAKFGHSTSYAGKNDWRMPSIDELRTLVYCSSGSRDSSGACDGDYQRPTLNVTAFPSSEAFFVWSGSPDAANSDDAWDVFFYYGSYYRNSKNETYPVRLVRGQ